MMRQKVRSILFPLLLLLSSGLSAITTAMSPNVADDPPRFLTGKLTSATFGSDPTITIESDKGIPTTLRVIGEYTLTVDSAAATLTDLWVKRKNQTLKVLGQKVQAGDVVRGVWDSPSWTTYLNEHQGVQVTQIQYRHEGLWCSPSKTFQINADTKFILNGAEVNESEFPFLSNTNTWFYGDISSGYPVAKIVGDTTASVSETRKRPSSGQKQRPTSTGTGNGPNFLVEIEFKLDKVYSGTDKNVTTAVVDALAAKYECFGKLSFNNEPWWNLPESDAKKNKLVPGKSLKVKPKKDADYGINGKFNIRDNTLHLVGVLKDRDGKGKSEVMMNVNQTIDLVGLVNKGPTTFPSTNPRLTLVITVTNR